MKLNDILSAINLADFEGVKEVSVKITDLKELSNRIVLLEKQLNEQRKEVSILRSKISLKILNKPIRLDTYA